VIHQTQPEPAAHLLQSTHLLGVQKQPHALDRGGTQHHQRCGFAPAPAAFGIHHHHATGAATAGFHLHMADHGIALQLHAAGGQGPGQGTALGAGARPGTEAPVAQAETARMDQRQVEITADAGLDMPLGWGQWQWWLERAIG
jgi:hypothetical protein